MTIIRIRRGIRVLSLSLRLTGLLLLVAAPATWFLLPPPKLTARTVISVAAVQPHILYDVDETGQDSEAFMRTQMSFIRSPNVLRAALREPEVAKLSMIRQVMVENIDPQQWLEEKLEIESAGPEFLRIGISGDNPEELSTLVKAVTRSYMREVVGAALQKRKDHLNKLMKVKTEFEGKLRKLEVRMKPVEEVIGVGDRDTSRLQAEHRKLERFLGQAEDLIQKMEVEEDTPQRVIWLGQKKDEDGKDIEEESIYAPSNRTTRLVDRH
jgi:hypothetical protein